MNHRDFIRSIDRYEIPAWFFNRFISRRELKQLDTLRRGTYAWELISVAVVVSLANFLWLPNMMILSIAITCLASAVLAYRLHAHGRAKNHMEWAIKFYSVLNEMCCVGGGVLMEPAESLRFGMNCVNDIMIKYFMLDFSINAYVRSGLPDDELVRIRRSKVSVLSEEIGSHIRILGTTGLTDDTEKALLAKCALMTLSLWLLREEGGVLGDNPDFIGAVDKYMGYFDKPKDAQVFLATLTTLSAYVENRKRASQTTATTSCLAEPKLS